DEFVIMLPETDNLDYATALIAEIRRRLSDPYIVDGHEIVIAASIGVAVYPRDGQSLCELMKQADIAMYQNKCTGNSISIIEQCKEDVGDTGLFDPEYNSRIHGHDLSAQNGLAHTQEQQ
ncbi:MAG: diguanylate cyclase domain-containing protein, partial [Acidiferrobacterales bacterium]